MKGRYIGHDKKPVHLIGTSRVAKIEDSKDKIIRIIWTEVAKKSKSEPKYFAKPVMMTLSAPKVTKGTKLADSDGAITTALTNLKPTKSKVKLKDKYSDIRRILEPVTDVDSSSTSASSSSLGVATEVIGGSTKAMDKPSYNGLDDQDNTSSGSGNGASRQVGSSYDRYRSRDRDRDRDRDRYMDRGRGMRQSEVSDIEPRGRHHTVMGDGSDISDIEDNSPKLNTTSISDDGESYISGTGSDETGLHTSSGSDGDGSHISGTEDNFPGLNTAFASGLGSDAPGLHTSSGSERESPTARTTPENNTRVKVVTDGCPVRLDYDNDRAIVQNKAVTFDGDTKVSETTCSDSLQHYLIKKNFLCENCRDYVNLEGMTACPTYEKYYTNGEDEKIVLTTEPEKDETQEFPIVPDGTECSPYIDLGDMLAYPQVQLVYQDRVNARKVAKICHRSDLAESTPITLTRIGCAPTHNFENDWSIAQKKGIFTLDGKQYTAFGCKEVGRPVPHEYDTGVCTSSVNVDERIVSVLGKRFVTIDDEKIYLSDCEPMKSEQVLMESTEGCEGEYEHKFDEGRSYLKKRWYWLDGLSKQFVTACNKSTEFLLHKEEVTGYENDDGNKRSKRIVTVYIEPDVEEREDLQTGYINPLSEPIPYELVSTTNEPTDSFAYAGCFKITQTNRYKSYNRADKTKFKQFLGVGTPLKSGDLCRRTTENKDVYHHTHVYAAPNRYAGDAGRNGYHRDVQDPDEKQYPRTSTQIQSWTEGRRKGNFGIGYYAPYHTAYKYFTVHKRIITHYPNGTTTPSTWSSTGQVVKRDEFWTAYPGL